MQSVEHLCTAFYTISTDIVLAVPLLSYLYESGDYRYETSLLETRKVDSNKIRKALFVNLRHYVH